MNQLDKKRELKYQDELQWLYTTKESKKKE